MPTYPTSQGIPGGATPVRLVTADGSSFYNAGSGVPRSFNDIVANLNRVWKTKWKPEYIDNPHAHYQPHTEADLTQTTKALRPPQDAI